MVCTILGQLKCNKKRIRASGNTQRYESMVRFHWIFLRISTPLALVFIPLILYLAITKPV